VVAAVVGAQLVDHQLAAADEELDRQRADEAQPLGDALGVFLGGVALAGGGPRRRDGDVEDAVGVAVLDGGEALDAAASSRASTTDTS
jgi:hypothetical protein